MTVDAVRLLSYNFRYGGSGREEALAGVIAACTTYFVILKEAAAPIVVSGRHWGGLRIGFKF